MRTTLNIDDDLMTLLKEKARSENMNLTRVVNDILRTNLTPGPKRTRFRQKTYNLGATPGMDLDKALNIAADMESEYTIGKMEVGK